MTLVTPPYRPHDITVVPVPGGFLIGRVLHAQPHGPWWEYLERVPDRAAAKQRARELAKAHLSRAWVYDDSYSELPLS